MTPEEFATVQRHIKDGLALNAELSQQQVALLRNIQSLLRGCIVVGGILLLIALMAIFRG